MTMVPLELKLSMSGRSLLMTRSTDRSSPEAHKTDELEYSWTKIIGKQGTTARLSETVMIYAN